MGKALVFRDITNKMCFFLKTRFISYIPSFYNVNYVVTLPPPTLLFLFLTIIPTGGPFNKCSFSDCTFVSVCAGDKLLTVLEKRDEIYRHIRCPTVTQSVHKVLLSEVHIWTLTQVLFFYTHLLKHIPNIVI